MIMPDSAHARVTRRIAADPTSTALLLAGPTAMDLWPGLRRVGESDGRVLIEAEMTGAETVGTGSVRALPPHRTPTAYITRFDVTGAGVPELCGTLTLSHDRSGDGTAVTRAELEVDADGLARTGLSEPGLYALARGFLENLAQAAEARSRAA